MEVLIVILQFEVYVNFRFFSCILIRVGQKVLKYHRSDKRKPPGGAGGLKLNDILYTKCAIRNYFAAACAAASLAIGTLNGEQET